MYEKGVTIEGLGKVLSGDILGVDCSVGDLLYSAVANGCIFGWLDVNQNSDVASLRCFSKG